VICNLIHIWVNSHSQEGVTLIIAPGFFSDHAEIFSMVNMLVEK
jgi:hypothetical protein